MYPGLLENCAEIIFETINLAERNGRRFMYLCRRPLYDLPRNLISSSNDGRDKADPRRSILWEIASILSSAVLSSDSTCCRSASYTMVIDAGYELSKE